MASSKDWRRNQQVALDDESKIDFKGMKFEYEYELAMAMRAFINAQIFGLDYLDRAIAIIENKLVRAYKDDEYINTVISANNLMQQKIRSSYGKKGMDEEKYNHAVHENIMARYNAVNELLFRKNMAPQMAEYGVLD